MDAVVLSVLGSQSDWLLMCEALDLKMKMMILFISEETEGQTDELVHNTYLLWWLLSTTFFVFVFSFSFSSFSLSFFLQLNKYKTVDSQSIQYVGTVWVSSPSQYRRGGGSETPDLVSTSGGRVTQFSNLWSEEEWVQGLKFS